ncbi:hypothetical protein BDQ12DRAFT_738011 [Crucibulum laeve]|uniref:Uncharacterized protein n=1 Tax=Crucibulum laeve TaxID=68775 RepID=A0A5C3LPU7_9AGAR|nr:hypothetical protein BDQ12DRAFT_738011 [Crucibulum laeve]
MFIYNCRADTTPKKSQSQSLSIRDTTPKKAQPHPSESIPSAPGIFNHSRSAGHIVPFQVLAFPVELETMCNWVDLHMDLKPGATDDSKRDWFMRAMRRRLPPACRQFCAVEFDDGLEICIIVATNKNEKELKQAQDVKKIEYVRRMLGLGYPPEWYQPEVM